MPSALELRWEFTPATLFEGGLSCEFGACRITVDEGVVLATMPLDADGAKSALRKAAESFVESMVVGAQIAEHVQCELGRPSVSTLHDDGSRAYILECEPGAYRIRGGRADFRLTRSDGTVVDTREDRIERKHRLSRSAANFGPHNDSLARMLRSYRSAIADADDELIHLYEVLDTLTSKFGSQGEALRRLGLPKVKWSRLGRLCNELPLRQGRHRGRATEPLRSASVQELTEARSLSAEFIESYMRYLECTQHLCPTGQ